MRRPEEGGGAMAIAALVALMLCTSAHALAPPVADRAVLRAPGVEIVLPPGSDFRAQPGAGGEQRFVVVNPDLPGLTMAVSVAQSDGEAADVVAQQARAVAQAITQSGRFENVRELKRTIDDQPAVGVVFDNVVDPAAGRSYALYIFAVSNRATLVSFVFTVEGDDRAAIFKTTDAIFAGLTFKTIAPAPQVVARPAPGFAKAKLGQRVEAAAAGVALLAPAEFAVRELASQPGSTSWLISDPAASGAVIVLGTMPLANEFQTAVAQANALAEQGFASAGSVVSKQQLRRTIAGRQAIGVKYQGIVAPQAEESFEQQTYFVQNGPHLIVLTSLSPASTAPGMQQLFERMLDSVKLTRPQAAAQAGPQARGGAAGLSGGFCYVGRSSIYEKWTFDGRGSLSQYSENSGSMYNPAAGSTVDYLSAPGGSVAGAYQVSGDRVTVRLPDGVVECKITVRDGSEVRELQCGSAFYSKSSCN